MKRANIHDAKNNLLRYLEELTPGETLMICRGMLHGKAFREPKIGVAKDEFVIPDSFFEPLPDEILSAFGGI